MNICASELAKENLIEARKLKFPLYLEVKHVRASRGFYKSICVVVVY
jgi:hypothetical protein